MTMASLSGPRLSTIGLAPVFSITMRFWISVESLNRPPTLFTMPSSFSSSSMLALPKLVANNSAHVADCRVQVVVDHLMLILAGPGQLCPGGRQSSLDHVFSLGAAATQPLLQ